MIGTVTSSEMLLKKLVKIIVHIKMSDETRQSLYNKLCSLGSKKLSEILNILESNNLSIANPLFDSLIHDKPWPSTTATLVADRSLTPRISNTGESLFYKAYVESKNFEHALRQAEKGENLGTQINNITPDILAIKLFLKNPAAMDKQLSKINAELEKRATTQRAITKGTPYNPTLRSFDGFGRGKVVKHDKLFSGYVKDWAREHGFADTVKADTFLAPNDFLSLLIARAPIKDSLFRGTGHGEWTHVLQWMCIALHYLEDPTFLSKPPADLYSWIGVTDSEASKTSEAKNTLWFSTFEVDTVSHYSVGALHNYLVSDQCMRKFPVLAQLIAGREAKVKPLHSGMN